MQKNLNILLILSLAIFILYNLFIDNEYFTDNIKKNVKLTVNDTVKSGKNNLDDEDVEDVEDVDDGEDVEDDIIENKSIDKSIDIKLQSMSKENKNKDKQNKKININNNKKMKHIILKHNDNNCTPCNEKKISNILILQSKIFNILTNKFLLQNIYANKNLPEINIANISQWMNKFVNSTTSLLNINFNDIQKIVPFSMFLFNSGSSSSLVYYNKKNNKQEFSIPSNNGTLNCNWIFIDEKYECSVTTIPISNIINMIEAVFSIINTKSDIKSKIHAPVRSILLSQKRATFKGIIDKSNYNQYINKFVNGNSAITIDVTDMQSPFSIFCFNSNNSEIILTYIKNSSSNQIFNIPSNKNSENCSWIFVDQLYNCSVNIVSFSHIYNMITMFD